jgi:hypothetical protein
MALVYSFVFLSGHFFVQNERALASEHVLSVKFTMPLSPRNHSSGDTWVELPESRYGIEYALRGETKQWKERISAVKKFRRTVRLGLTTGSKKITKELSPFEAALERLNNVIRGGGHSDGTAVMYIREIIEPDDWEFDSISEHAYVCATQLSQEQVGRLRIMVLPKRREEILVSYLDRYRTSNQSVCVRNERVDVLRDFDAFDRRFITITDEKMKFDVLFGFTFAVKMFSEWMFRYECQRKREKKIASLAKHWRKLLGKFKPEELGCDQEFSYPALLAFLEDFKRQTESIETFKQCPIKFDYQPEINVKVVSFDDDTNASLTKSVKTRTSN